jgi:hypothetical protein
MLLIKQERRKLVTFRSVESMEDEQTEADNEAKTENSNWLGLGENEGESYIAMEL